MRTMRCDQLEVIMSIISIWNCRRESNVIRNMNEIDIDQGIMKDPDLESATGSDFYFFDDISTSIRNSNGTCRVDL